MPDDLEQIRTIKSQTLAALAEATANPKPSYDIDGQQVLWSEYLAQLQRSVEWCDARLAGYEPFEVRSQGFAS